LWSPRSTGERGALRVSRQGAARIQVLVEGGNLSVLVEFDDGAVVVLREEQRAIVVRKDPIRVVSDNLPDLRPTLAAAMTPGISVTV
jgi:hypothetical protein